MKATDNKERDKRKNRRNLRALVTTLSAVMVFVVTYTLILPAITLEEKKANDLPGIYLEKPGEGNSEEGRTADLTDDQDADEETTHSEKYSAKEKAADNEESYKGKDKDEAARENQESVDSNNYKDQTQEAEKEADEKTSFISAQSPLSCETKKYEIFIAFDEKAKIPEGTRFIVEPVRRDSREYQDYYNAVKKEMVEDTAFTRGPLFRLSLTKDGKEVIPEGKVDLLIRTKEDKVKVPGTLKGVAWHTTRGILKSQISDKSLEETDASLFFTESWEQVNKQHNVFLQDYDFTDMEPVVGIVSVSGKNNDKKKDQSNSEVEDEDSTKTLSPAQSFEGKAGKTKVTVKAPEGALPAGTTIKVTEVKDSKTIDAVTEVVESAETDDSRKKNAVKDIQAVDITFFNAEGKEIEPEVPIHVTMSSGLVKDAVGKDNLQITAVHLPDKGKAEVVDCNLPGEAGGKKLEENEMSFDADSFSVYAMVTYTVDFHWEVDGENYEFSIPGGGFVSFADLVEILGITNPGVTGDKGPEATEENRQSHILDVEVSEATREFVADVSNVEFSTPELLSVSKVEKNTTVEAIKADLNLSCEYSVELTDEQIEEINSQIVDAGDWALISLKPFQSAESLTVTLKNGDVFTIKVTDAQMKQTVISASGDTYEITVSYDDTAKIPDDAELRVKEIKEDDKDYTKLQNDIANNLKKGAEDIPAHPVLFDIAIMAGDKEIEPAEGSQVKVEVKLVKSAVKGMYTDEDSPLLVNDQPVSEKTGDFSKALQVIHQVEEGQLEVMKTKDSEDDKKFVSEFTTESFSDWLLFLDEDLASITVHEGDTLTLRPYTEWVWKQSDLPSEYQGGEWIFPSDAWDQSSSSEIVPPTYNWEREKTVYFTDYTSKGAGSGANKFHVFDKEDTELQENYKVARSDPLKAGEFDLKTNKGKTIHVTVLPGTSSAKPATIPDEKIISGLTVNLFDYDVPGNWNNYDFTKSGDLDAQSNTASNPNNNNNINTNHDLKFLGYGGGNTSDDQYLINNYSKSDPNQKIVKTQLGEDGYPELAPYETNTGPWWNPVVSNDRADPSLKYLFDTSSHDHNVYAFPNADGLFQRDKLGYYFYNSNVNYAEYNQSTNKFTLYEHTYSQDTSGSGGANAKPIGFFPFHEYDTNNTQAGMNFNTALNHHFGMSMEVKFELPKGKRAPDDYGFMHDIIYEFSGDDDLWVFVDDELVLDIGGIHQPVTGSINFTTGVIKVHGVGDITKTFDVGTHTLKMFYIERGGCDSNLSVKFNLPLVLGQGNITLRKKSANSDTHGADTALSGATFGIWDNPLCEGEPYTVATSDNNGLIFKDLPIRSENQVYYMQEMYPPDGYLLDKTIYILTAVKGNDNVYRFNVSVDGETITDIETSTGYPIIRNKAAEDIEVSVYKEWENADGSRLEEPEVTEATFNVKRKRTYTANHSDLIKVRMIGYKRGSNGAIIELPDNELDEIYAENGDILTIKYRHSPSPPAPNTPGDVLARQQVSSYYTAATLTVNPEGNDQTISYTVDMANALNGTIDLLIPEEFTDWCNGKEYAAGDNPHFTGYGRGQHELITEDDRTFNEQITVTSPTWKGSLENLPVFEKIGNTSYFYEYYIKEANIPEGYEAVYYKDGKPIAGPTSSTTIDSEEMQVVNRKLMDVPIEKEWPDYSGDNYTWEATFQLEEMEVKVNESDPDDEDAILDFQAVAGKVLTVSKGQSPQPAFTGLPMYRTRSNGTVYRILYSVDEIAYKVISTLNGETVVQWRQDGSIETLDPRYEPIFVQDAGEHGATIGDYEIIIVNDLENRELDKSIDLSIEKKWPEGSSYASANDTYAKFVLKRYVHEEYRDYSNHTGEWVTISLDTGQHAAGEEHILQKVTVPKGSTMHITGSIKANTHADPIEFTQSSGEESITYSKNNPNSSPEAFDITFTATQDKTIELYRGDNYVVGGRDGFILSTYTNRTEDQPDQHFAEAFTLNKADGWSRVFDYLPLVEEQKIDPKTGNQTIYVYSYYLEELESNPADFYPVFSSDFGVVGDKDHRINSDTDLTAENLQKTVDLTLDKVAKSDVDKQNAPTLEGAAFKLVKYKTNTFEEIDGSWGTNGEKVLTEKIAPKGEFTVDGLSKGFYKVIETAFPKGYVKTVDDPIFEVRYNSTSKELEIILLKIEGEGEDAHVVEAQNNKTDMVRIDLTTIVVGNTPGEKLPYTGGPGTRLFTILGMIMIAGAGLLLWRKRRII